MTRTDSGQQKIALDKLLDAAQVAAKRTATGSAKIIVYGAAVAIISQIYGWDIASLAAVSPILARLVEEIGGNVLSSVLERVATDEKLTVEDIQSLLEDIFSEVELDNLLTEQEFFRAIGKLQRQDSERFNILSQQLEGITSTLYTLRSDSKYVDLLEAQKLLASMPTNVLPEYGRLPSPSRMTLAPNPLFTGREDSLRVLAELIRDHQIAVISGIGGIGKTQLAAEFVHRYGKYFAGGVYWLEFSNYLNITAEITFCGLLMKLWDESEKLTMHEKALLVSHAWEDGLPRLLVFDGCESEEILAEWRPKGGETRVLVTSRRPNWDKSLGVEVVPLQIMFPSEGMKLLSKFATALDEEVAINISKELGGLPLAIHLAGSFLRRYQGIIDSKEYLNELRRSAIVDHPSLSGVFTMTSPTAHVMHVGRTFSLSYEQLDLENEIDLIAIKLLERASCFAPGEPIPWSFLSSTIASVFSLDLSATTGKRVVVDGLFRLEELGLLNVGEKHAVLMHPLIASFVHRVASLDQAQLDVERVIIGEAQNSFHVDGDVHPLNIQKHLRYLAESTQDKQDYRNALLNSVLGTHLRFFGDSSQSARYFERAIQYWNQIIDPTQFTPDDFQNLVARSPENLSHLVSSGLEDLSSITNAYMQRGIAYSALGQLQLAEEDYNYILELTPNNPAALRNRGIVKWIQGRISEAIDDYSKAIFHIPNFALAYLNRGEAYAELGQLEQAIADYDKALDINPKLEQAYILRARARAQLKILDEAIRDFSKAIELNDTRLRTLIERSNVHREIGNLEEALADIDKYMELEENEDKVYASLSRAEIYFHLERYEDALEALRHAEHKDKEYLKFVFAKKGQVQKALGQFDEAIESLTRSIEYSEGDKWPVAHRGHIYYSTGEYEKAITDFNQALKIDANFLWALEGRAFSYRRLRQYKNAVRDLNRAVKVSNNDHRILVERAKTFYLMKRFRRALSDLNQAIRQDNQNADILAERGDTFRQLQEYEKALNDINTAIELSPSEPFYYSLRGEVNLAMKDYIKAITDFNKSIELGYDDHWILELKGESYFELGSYTDAIKFLDQANDKLPDCARCLKLRGRTLRKLKRCEDALSDFNRVIELNARDKIAIGERGETYKQMKVYDFALRDFNLATKIDRNYHWAFERKGEVLLAMGRPRDAVKSLRRAELINPECTSCIGILTDAYVEMGEYDKALKDLTRIIERNDKNKAFALVKRAGIYIKKGNIIEASSDLKSASSINIWALRDFGLKDWQIKGILKFSNYRRGFIGKVMRLKERFGSG